jgi:hypothetical protein
MNLITNMMYRDFKQKFTAVLHEYNVHVVVNRVYRRFFNDPSSNSAGS